MCGRARLSTDYSEIKIQFLTGHGERSDGAPWNASEEPKNLAVDEGEAERRRGRNDEDDIGVETSWNIPPTAQMVTVLRSADGGRHAEKMRWGLIPPWVKDVSKFPQLHNARADTVEEKPSFRGAWRAGRRCIVVISGFYEWRKRDKQAFTIEMADKRLMSCAGLWEEWKAPDGRVVRSTTIITTEPNDTMEKIHDRMPVILGEDDWAKWLGEEPATKEELKTLLRPCPDEWIRAWPVDNRVGNIRNNDRRLIDPIPDMPSTLL